MDIFLGEPTSFNLEHLIDDMLTLRDRFKEIGMVVKNGEVYLDDLEVGSNQKSFSN